MKKSLLTFMFLIVIVSVSCLCPCRKFDPLKNGKGVAYSSDGTEILYEVSGKGEIGLVFVHGWCCDRTYFKKQIMYFSNKYRVVAVDLAGHGASANSRKNYSMELFADDVNAVVNKLNLKKVILVGHSMGGYVVLESERRLNGKVLGLVFVDTLEDVSAKFPEKLVSNLLKNFSENFKENSKSFIKGFFNKTSDKKLVEYVVNDMSAENPEVAISAFENLADYNNNKLTNYKNKIDIPVFSINVNEKITNIEANKDFFNDYNVVFMSGLSHFPMMEDAEGFNDILEQALSDILAGN